MTGDYLVQVSDDQTIDAHTQRVHYWQAMAAAATQFMGPVQVVNELKRGGPDATASTAQDGHRRKPFTEREKLAGALATAAWAGDVKAVRLLSQIRPDARCSKLFGCPAHNAVIRGNQEAAEYLLQRSGDVLERDSLDRSTMHWVAINGDE